MRIICWKLCVLESSPAPQQHLGALGEVAFEVKY